MSDSSMSPSSSPSPPPFPQCDYSEWTPTFFIIPSVYLLAFVLGSLGNSLVLWVYLDRAEGKKTGSSCTKNLRRSRLLSAASSSRHPRSSRSLTDSLIASLALADLAFVVTLPLWASYTALDYHWLFGGPLCRVSSFLVALNMYASVFSLSALSVERYWVLAGRRRSSHSQKRSRVFWVVGGVWVLAGVLALPALVLRTVKEVELGAESEDELHSALDPTELATPSAIIVCSCQMDYSSLIGAELEEDRERAEMMWTAALGLKSTLIGFLLPLAILLVCYCSLARLLSRHFGRGPRPDRKCQRRLLRVIVTLVMAFFLCWLPLHVNKTLSMMLELGLLPYSCPLDQVLLTAHPYVTCLAYLNSCLNPLLYACCDPAFRRRCSALLQWRRWGKACRKERLGVEGDRGEEEEGEQDEDREQASSSAFPTRTQEDTGVGVEEGEDVERAREEIGEGEDKRVPSGWRVTVNTAP
ncbi:apelin receptor 2 [Aplochiton taeniatus]